MALIGVMYALSLRCPRCQQPVPVNGAVERVVCPRCQASCPTPAKFWAAVLAEPTGEVAGWGGEGRAAGGELDEGAGVEGSLDCRRQAPRCGGCETAFTEDVLAASVTRGGGLVTCRSCARSTRVRPPPPWLRAVHPRLVALVGEASAPERGAPSVATGGVRFHCYHCGAAMPLDGSKRVLPCGSCRQEVVVPEAIWSRFHPGSTVVEPWFALLDAGEGVGLLPEDAAVSCDGGSVEGAVLLPGGRFVLAWHQGEAGEAGHTCRLGAADTSGVLAWVQDGVEFSNDSRLLVSPREGSLLLVDAEQRFIRVIDPRDGQPLRTLRRREDAPEPGFELPESALVTVDADGTLLVLGDWPEGDSTTRRMRRFAPDGAPVDLWPRPPEAPAPARPRSFWSQLFSADADATESPEAREPVQEKGWPVRPDRFEEWGVLLSGGLDGKLSVCLPDRKEVARYSRQGEVLDIIKLPAYVEEVRAMEAGGDGVLYLLFEHAQSWRNDTWTHVARIHPDGRFELWLGPHAPQSPVLLHTNEGKLHVSPDGMLLIADELDSLRILDKDGRLLFRTASAERRDAELAEAWARRHGPRRRVADREG